MSIPHRGVVVYLLLVFGLTWPIEIVLVRRYPPGSAAYIAILGGIMFIPALSALIVRLFVERQGFADAGLRWGMGRFYLVAWLLSVLFSLGAMGLSLVLRQAEFDPYMTETMVAIKLQFGAMDLPYDRMRTYFIVSSLTQSVIIATIPCFGEEFGWRSYLLMRLLPLGRLRAMILTGGIWGVWHAPIILQGYNYPDHPQLGVFLMISFCIILGIVLGWLRLASDSVFPAALAHASINSSASVTLAFLRSRSDVTTGLTGLLGQGMMLVFVLSLWRSGALKSALHSNQGENHA